MPKGIVWLAIGTLIGVGLGLILADDLVVGGAAGFIIALVLLLTGNWLGGDVGEDGDEIHVSGR